MELFTLELLLLLVLLFAIGLSILVYKKLMAAVKREPASTVTEARAPEEEQPTPQRAFTPRNAEDAFQLIWKEEVSQDEKDHHLD